MFLAFNLADIIIVPFGYLMDGLYRLTTNYGVALIIFAVVVKLILLPATAKGKKNTMKMSRLTPQLQRIQTKYADDPQRQQQAVSDLYKSEGVSMAGGCLWSLVPMLILIPLYAVVRQPIQYMLHETLEVANEIVQIVKNGTPELFTGNAYYHEMVAARHIPAFVETIKASIPTIKPETLVGLNFNFLGIDLGTVPQFNVLDASWVWDWSHIGAFILPCLSAGSQVLTMFISQKMNNSLVTDKNGVQDEETAKNSQQAQSMQMMMWMMPLMSLFIGFSVPGALSLYWMVQGVVSLVMDIFLTRHYRKIYDAEDAVRIQRMLEQEALEAEKERIRAERRAANPDGITENTSKKKQQRRQQQERQAAKAANARAYAAERGVEPEEEPGKAPLSGIADRPYCKGRAYDPDRYRTTEE